MAGPVPVLEGCGRGTVSKAQTNWKGAHRWARLVASGEWKIREYDPEKDTYSDPKALTKETLNSIYPRDIFALHRWALDQRGGLR